MSISETTVKDEDGENSQELEVMSSSSHATFRFQRILGILSEEDSCHVRNLTMASKPAERTRSGHVSETLHGSTLGPDPCQ